MVGILIRVGAEAGIASTAADGLTGGGVQAGAVWKASAPIGWGGRLVCDPSLISHPAPARVPATPRATIRLRRT